MTIEERCQFLEQELLRTRNRVFQLEEGIHLHKEEVDERIARWSQVHNTVFDRLQREITHLKEMVQQEP